MIEMRMIGNPEYNQEEKRQKVSNRIEKKLLYGSGGIRQTSDSERLQRENKHRETLNMDTSCKRQLRSSLSLYV